MPNQAITFDAPLKQATTVAAPAGVSFDAPLQSSTSISVPSQGQESVQPTAPKSDEIQINPSDNILTKGAKAVGGVLEGIGEGVFGTAAGASDLLDKTTGMTPGAGNAYLHKLAGDQNATHGAPQSVGRGIEDIGEFILGDEALKGLSVSERLLKASKAAQVIEESPILNRIFNAGVRALRGGAVAGVQGEVKSGGDTSAALRAGAMGAVGNAVVPEAIDAGKAVLKVIPGATDAIVTQATKAAKAIQAPFSLKAIQPKVQGAIMTAIRDAAQEHGITIPDGVSVRDITQSLSDAVREKASAIYKQIDAATGGGRFQRFDEQLKNIQRGIREATGIDPDREGALIERFNTVQDAKNAALQEAKQAGVDPNLIDQADKLHRQAMALQDVGKAIRASTDAHPSLATDPYNGNAAAKRLDVAINGKPASGEAPANVRTAPLFKRIQQLATPNPKYPGTPSRLVQALGEQRAEALLHAVDAAHLYAQKVAARNVWLKRGAAAVGLYGLGREVFNGAHDLFSGGQ